MAGRTAGAAQCTVDASTTTLCTHIAPIALSRSSLHIHRLDHPPVCHTSSCMYAVNALLLSFTTHNSSTPSSHILTLPADEIGHPPSHSPSEALRETCPESSATYTFGASMLLPISTSSSSTLSALEKCRQPLGSTMCVYPFGPPSIPSLEGSLLR